MPEEPRLIHPNANGSPKAGTPKMIDQRLRHAGFVSLGTTHVVQHIRTNDIVTFGPCAIQTSTDARGNPIGPVHVELGKCTIIVRGVGPIVVDHTPETVASLIHELRPIVPIEL